MAGEPLGLIAGNGRFPFLAAAGARRAGRRVVALAIKEEASPELAREVDELHWISLGQLGRGIELLKGAGAREAVMAGQVQHRQLFSDVVPDLKLIGVLARLALRNTDSLIGGVADALARDGITLLPSVAFLEDQLAVAGPMTRRRPDGEEEKDIAYGESVARTLAGMDLGQTAVVKGRAAVALEAMEGTDETIRRAGRIAGTGTTVVKVSKPKQDMRFDVPVVGEGTLDAMREAGARVLAIDAGRTLADRPGGLPRARRTSTAWRSWGSGRRKPARPMPEGTLRAGVIGVGALGRHHARVWSQVPERRLAGVHDADAARAAEVAAQHGCRAYPDLASLLAERRRGLGGGPHVAPPRRRQAGARGRPRRARREADHGDARRGRRPRRVRGEPRARAAGRAHRALQPRDRRAAPGRPRRALRRGAPAGLLLPAQPRRGRRARPHGPRPRHRPRARRHASRSRSRPWASPC